MQSLFNGDLSFSGKWDWCFCCCSLSHICSEKLPRFLILHVIYEQTFLRELWSDLVFSASSSQFWRFDKVRLIWLKMSIWHEISQEARFQHPSPNFPLNSLSDENARWYHCSTFLSECEDGWIKIVHILEELGFFIYITPQTETHLSQINLSYFWTYYINNS